MAHSPLDFDVESLEQRTLLAGAVQVSVVGGNLTIKGDDVGNLLKISSTVEAGTLMVHGLDGTMIDGEATQIVSGIDRGIRIHLKGGDNSVLLKRETFTSFQLDRGVSIRAGNGHDVAGLFGVDVGGKTTIQLGDGDNYAEFSNGRTRGLKVTTGDGADLAYLHNSNHLRGFNVRTGDGDDIIKSGFNEFFVAANTIKAGQGDDLVDVSHSMFNTSRAPLVDGQAGEDGFYGRYTFATGNRNTGFEYDLRIGETTGPLETHRGTPIYNELFSYGGIAEGDARLEAAAGAAASTLIINAWGQTGEEHFNLLIDGQVVASYNAATTWTPFEYTSNGPLTPDQVRIEFTNDLYDPANGIDRNLFVNNIQIDGPVYETNSPDVFSTGTWTEADGVQPGFGRGIVLNANGYFQYGAGTQQTTVTVRARGETGAEAFRIVDNGEVIGQFNTFSTSFRDFSVGLDRDVSIDNLRIEFFNDSVTPEDRNLIVDYVSINGQIFQTEAPTTFASGVWVDGQIQSGFLQSEILHANGYFQYGSTAAVFDPTLQNLQALFPDRVFRSNLRADAFAAGDGGSIVIATEATSLTNSEPAPTPLVFKVDAFGNLDQSFANGGLIVNSGLENRVTRTGPTLGPGFPLFDSVELTVDASGRILLAGSQVGNSNRAVVRYLTNGQLDTSFANGGVATVTLGDDARFDEQRDLAVLDDGSILSVATFFLPFEQGGGQGTSAWKLTDSGAFDTSYGQYSGVAILGTRGNQHVIDSQGRVLVGTNSQLRRIAANGYLDASFGTDGIFQTDQGFDVGFDRLAYFGDGGGACTPLSPFVSCDNTLTDLQVDQNGSILLFVRQEDAAGRSSSIDRGMLLLVLTDFGQLNTDFSDDGAEDATVRVL